MHHLLSFSDIQHILSIKLLLVVFVISGLLFLYKKWHPLIFLLLTGTLIALSYSILVDDLGLMFWGLRGDEVTIAAMYQMFAHGSFFSDFGFPELPPFYPPFFFWLFAIPGKIFQWNGVMMAKVATATTMFIFPALTYVIQSRYWKTHTSESNTHEVMPGIIAWFLAPFLIFFLTDWDAFILKPYEILAAMGSVLWVSYLLNDLHRGVWSKTRVVVYALTGGVLFMMYYLWLIYGAMAIALSGLFVPKKEQGKFYLRLIILAVLTLLVAIPYLGPLVHSYAVHGTENWPVAFMSLRGLDLYVQMVQWFSWRGIVLLFGFIVLLWYRHVVYIRSLLLLFIVGYIWQIMGWTTILLFAAPLQEFKPFDFYHFTILAFAAAYGIERGYVLLKERYVDSNKQWQIVVPIVGLVFITPSMIFGSFIDDPRVQERRLASKEVGLPVRELVEYLQTERVFPGLKTVHSSIGQVHAFVPINSYIYFNQHNNHPATRFSEKFVYLDIASKSSTPAELYQAVSSIPAGPIDRFILYKNYDNPDYELYFHVDDFPNGAKDQGIYFKKTLFAEPYFTKKLENREFVVWERNVDIAISEIDL